MRKDPCDLNRLVQECVDHRLLWLLDKAESWPPWNDEWIGLIQPNCSKIITPEIMDFFRGNGWCLEVGDNASVYMAPLIYIDPPAFLYHLTPCWNLESICENGLLTGEEADQCTSGRSYCGHSIYVCINEGNARKWASEKLIGASGCKEWAMLRINEKHLTGGVYRDPASLTGYILDDKIVLRPEFMGKIYFGKM